jgi:hypothetical protein
VPWCARRDNTPPLQRDCFAQSSSVTLQKLADYPLLYIAHLGQGVVHVFDTQAHTLIGTVEGVPAVRTARGPGTGSILGVPVLREMFLQTLPEPDD